MDGTRCDIHQKTYNIFGCSFQMDVWVLFVFCDATEDGMTESANIKQILNPENEDKNSSLDHNTSFLSKYDRILHCVRDQEDKN